MLNIQALKINPFTEYLVKSFERTFGTNDQEIITFCGPPPPSRWKTLPMGTCSITTPITPSWWPPWGPKSFGANICTKGLLRRGGTRLPPCPAMPRRRIRQGSLPQRRPQVEFFEDGKGKRVEVSPTGTCALLSPSMWDAARFLSVNTSITRTWLTLNWFARASNGLNSPYLGENDIRELQICPD